MSGLGQELASERSRTTELQKASEQSQESFTKLQSDFYGKESEVSALRQDLKVGLCRKGWRSRDEQIMASFKEVMLNVEFREAVMLHQFKLILRG